MSNHKEEKQTRPRVKKGLATAKKALFHPIVPLILLAWICREVQESYPFSHFPMYSNPNADPVPYCYIADGNDSPLAVLHHTGLTAPKLRKIYKNELKKVAKQEGIRDRDKVPDPLKEEIAKEIIITLRKKAESRNRPLPEEVRFYRVLIEMTPTEFAEARTLIAKG